ncbi:matrixin family metalloprotease [Patescibacteria group bacterium]|nr:matrixin family metalloprotease [Patescibacteria group bacterium]
MFGRITKIALLLLIILFCASFVVFRYYGNQIEANWFNDQVREYLTRYPLLRGIYALHWDGDAKSDYLSTNDYQKLIVEIDSIEACQKYFINNDSLINQISELVQKPEGVKIVVGDPLDDDEMVYLDSNSMDRAINGIKDRLQDNKSKDQHAVLYVLCLDYNRDAPTNIGLTYQDDTVLLFFDEIEKLTKENPDSLPIYLKTTLLHEFGHQLGLGHVDDNNCLMAETIENPGNSAAALKNIPQQFCQPSLSQLDEYRLIYQTN